MDKKEQETRNASFPVCLLKQNQPERELNSPQPSQAQNDLLCALVKVLPISQMKPAQRTLDWLVSPASMASFTGMRTVQGVQGCGKLSSLVGAGGPRSPHPP